MDLRCDDDGTPQRQTYELREFGWSACLPSKTVVRTALVLWATAVRQLATRQGRRSLDTSCTRSEIRARRFGDQTNRQIPALKFVRRRQPLCRRAVRLRASAGLENPGPRCRV